MANETKTGEANKAQHTPGPWFAREMTMPHENADCVAIQARAGDALCVVCPENMGGTEAVDANARLIAQAPAMFSEMATLRRLLVASISRTAFSDSPAQQEQNEKAEAALVRVDAILAAIDGSAR